MGSASRFVGAAAILGVSVAALAALPGCSVEHEGMVEIGTITRTESPGSATRLFVRGLVGDVHVKPSKNGSVTIRATVFVREAMQASFTKPDVSRDVRIEIEEDDFVVESCHIEPPTGAEWRIDFDIEAPTDLRWCVSTIQRTIHLEPDGNDVSADVHLGDIKVTGRPDHVRLESKLGEVVVDAQCVTGGELRADADDIKLTVKSTPPSEALTLLSLQGGIEMQLPKSTAAEVDLRSGLGDVTVSGATVPVQAVRSGHAGKAEIGGGGVKIQAIAEKGDVSLALK